MLIICILRLLIIFVIVDIEVWAAFDQLAWAGRSLLRWL